MIRSFVAEGRTVFLSSHLLDEVEKTCDHVAIVDRGRVLAQGAVAEIAGGGDPTVSIDVDDAAAARRLLAAEPLVRRISDDGTTLTVAVSDGLDAAELNRALVGAGIGVSRLEPVRATLEERFLDITSRLEKTP